MKPIAPHSIRDWQKAWASDFSATASVLLAQQALRLQEASNVQSAVWISLTPLDDLEQAIARLHTLPRSPIWGVPFAVKDNIDVIGVPTTAGCAEFAYAPQEDAPAVALLREAGALCLGKTNLDQFATGLNGTRTPYGIPSSVFGAAYISGGSSSGSAVAVAQGDVAFALGTDTAGSGRVPAACNALVGLKPSKGLISTRGVVPACRSLDCVSIFSHTLADAQTVLGIAAKYDEADPYARRSPSQTSLIQAPIRLATLSALQFFGDHRQQNAWTAWRQALETRGIMLTEIDPSPFLALAPLLYNGPWVAERLAAIHDFLIEHADAVHPVVRDIVLSGSQFSALEAFQAEYQRAALSRHIAQALAPFDALVVPTMPIFPTIESVLAEPLARNSELGTYTNFVNLADLCALAIPAGERSDGLPFGVTLIAPAFEDARLLELAQVVLNEPQAQAAWAQDHEIAIAVVGAHLSGMPLNHQLTARHARLLSTTSTAPSYRLYALAHTTPPKPGLVFDPSGSAIAVEVWALPRVALADFLSEIPAPLGLGQLTLADGRQVTGFICEPRALIDAEDISHYGGWKAYRAPTAAPRSVSDV